MRQLRIMRKLLHCQQGVWVLMQVLHTRTTCRWCYFTTFSISLLFAITVPFSVFYLMWFVLQNNFTAAIAYYHKVNLFFSLVLPISTILKLNIYIYIFLQPKGKIKFFIQLLLPFSFSFLSTSWTGFMAQIKWPVLHRNVDFSPCRWKSG